MEKREKREPGRSRITGTKTGTKLRKGKEKIRKIRKGKEQLRGMQKEGEGNMPKVITKTMHQKTRSPIRTHKADILPENSKST